MQYATEKATLLHGRRSHGPWGRDSSRPWGRRRESDLGRTRCRRASGQAELRPRSGGGKQDDVENDGGTNHRQVKDESYQSVMKSIFASLIVALFAVSVSGKDTQYLAPTRATEEQKT